jgi:multidrug efflux pump subunit AcrA (membrane-fusion protein)
VKKYAAGLLLVLALCACSSQPAAAPAAVPVAVTVGRARQMRAAATVAVSGSVVSPDNPSSLAFLVAGKVIRVGPREGDFVRRGQVLAVIDPTDYAFGVNAASAQAAMARAQLEKAESPVRPELLEQARVGYERARDEYQRMKQLYEAKALPPNDFDKFKAGYEAARQQYEQAKAGGQKEDRAQARAAYDQASAGEKVARKKLSDATLVSPIDGYVAARAVEVGDVAAPGRPVFQIVQLDPVEVNVGVPETDIHLVRIGQTAAVQAPAIPGGAFQGVVRAINVAADPSTRTYMVRIRVPNPKHVLRIGMIAEAQIRGDSQLDLLTLPGDAIVRDAQGATIVYAYYPDQKRVHARRVEVGTVYGREIEIRKGVTLEDRLVLGGQNKLRDGTLVEAADAPASGEGK